MTDDLVIPLHLGPTALTALLAFTGMAHLREDSCRAFVGKRKKTGVWNAAN